MKELTSQELIGVDGGNLFAMMLGAICGIGDNLTDGYVRRVMSTDPCDLMD